MSDQLANYELHLQKYSFNSFLSNTHFSLSALYVWAISGTSGSSGFGSQRREQIDNNTVEEWNRTVQKLKDYIDETMRGTL